MVTLAVDGRSITVPEGTSVWEAARRLGIDIPVLCHDPRMKPVGVCRLCVVDAKGQRVNPASCVRGCEEGMEVRTDTPDLERRRKVLVELLLADHPSPCERQRATGDCDLEALGARYGVLERQRWHRGGGGPAKPADPSSKVISVDHASCILCDRCIRGCDDLQSNEVIGRNGKGFLARIGFDDDRPMGDSTCVSCGECAAVCPTGALVSRPVGATEAPRASLKAVKSVCPYCGVGCAITYFTDGRTVVSAEGRESPVNHGRLCVKGRYGFDYSLHPQRLRRPLIRISRPRGALSGEVKDSSAGTRRRKVVDYAEILPHFREASWEEALDLVAKRFGEIRAASGPGSLAGFGSAKCSNEEAYLFQKLVRAVFGTNNVDHCTRLCHASSVAALLEGIGSGAVSNVFADVKHADVAMLIGTNTTENHPVAATFFKEAAKNGTKLIVIDPRRPHTADFATHYVRFRPGTDVAFLNAMLHVIVAEGMVDEAFVAARTTGFEALKATVAKYTPEFAAEICGVTAEEIRAVARTYGSAKAAIMFWGMGISQHTTGTDNARCLIALCLATGNIGRPGTGLHPLRGQNNVQGASDAGLIPMVFPDYQPVEDAGIRARFEKAWGRTLDPKRGLTVVEIMKAALEGRVKGMYMMGENPFMSDPNQNKVRRALSSLDFLVVQDIFLTETAEFADVILPASTALEKDGTYTNSDRRVQVGRKVVEPPGEAREDWRILCDVATRMGYPMRYGSAAEVFDELASLSPALRGLSHANLGDAGKLWPCPDPETDGINVLFDADFPTPDGRGRFVPAEWMPAAELPDGEYPMVLNTGRVLEHWHTGSMTRRSKALDALEPAAFAEIHPEDAARLGIADGDAIRVTTRRGTIATTARVGDRTHPGSLFIPFHFREAPANCLTNDALDPFGKIPEFKFCAVRVERIVPGS
ncbi:MAG: formate dehydrogenase subunit alpha [Planctomycetaceae bacterium]|nr:formate dehydrogenase subunit alpha [Planctomycetota bacterium]NUN51249.1 formate dehydrogenase subunit alpha [Planctomycetaceae bacterium]